MIKQRKKLDQWLNNVPIVAIIRGVTPTEVVDIGQAIFDAGIGIIEVPLNSPEPFKSIEKLSHAFGQECVIGCGTLTNIKDIDRVAKAGAEIVVTPSTQPNIIKRCITTGMIPIPGWATPTDAFSAHQAGARYLKLFPAATYGGAHIKAVTAVLPSDIKILAVGGVGAHNAKQWLRAGVDGFGIGSEIYEPGDTPEKVRKKTKAIVLAIEQAKIELQ